MPPSQIEIKCQECGELISWLSDDELQHRLDSGDVIKGTRFFRGPGWNGGQMDMHTDGYWSICRPCKRKERTLADNASSDKAADAQMIRIRQRVEFLRERRPDLTLQEVVRAAIDDEYDPHHEGDRGFRAYLLGEGAPKDAAIDAAARAFMEGLGE